MCGIAGIVRWDREKPQEPEIQTMTRALSHRGPDGEGFFIRDGVAMGHRRLSIIDLETGSQPLSNEDATVWITFNGEIYNYRKLRHVLQQKGHQFSTHSDTEVIVHAYEEWDEQCVERLRGMFAFGIADFRKQRLFLARDHLGIKPLYYVHTPRCFAFASEIQSLRCIPDVALDLDMQGIDQYLWLQYIPAPTTAFKQIRKIPPAHRMSLTFDGNLFEPKRYWHIEFRPDYNRNENEWLEALDNVLRDSVRAHLVSDVPFGAFLSGGVDSSAVVGYMAQILNRPIKTFTIGFEEKDFNELPYAQITAERWETDHHVEIVKPDALEILPKLVKHYGEPFGDSSALPMYYVCKMGRQHVPMVLSGDGGDESFAGYDSYRAWMHWHTSNRMPRWKKIIYPIARFIWPDRYPSQGAVLQNWLQFISPMPVSMRHPLWREEYRSVLSFPLEVFEKEFERTRGYGLINKVQYMDLNTYLPFDILAKVDVASMMHGLEVRTPLVDVRVVEFAATIPEYFNMARNGNGEWEGKLLLKKALERYYPADFVCRPKKGFGVPLQKWFSCDGPLRETVQDRLLGRKSTLHNFFEPAMIKQLVKSVTIYPLWILLFLEEWLRQNMLEVST